MRGSGTRENARHNSKITGGGIVAGLVATGSANAGYIPILERWKCNLSVRHSDPIRSLSLSLIGMMFDDRLLPPPPCPVTIQLH